MFKVKVILGSTRKNRLGIQVAEWVMNNCSAYNDLDVELLDLRDYPLPFFEEDTSPAYIKEPYKNKDVAKWTSKIAEAAGFIIVGPEYNHGYSAVLKNSLDYVYNEWADKPVAFVSYGSVGGARMVEQLRLVVVELHMIPLRDAVHIVAPWGLKDADGKLDLSGFDKTAGTMLDKLSWYLNKLSK